MARSAILLLLVLAFLSDVHCQSSGASTTSDQQQNAQNQILTTQTSLLQAMMEQQNIQNQVLTNVVGLLQKHDEQMDNMNRQMDNMNQQLNNTADQKIVHNHILSTVSSLMEKQNQQLEKQDQQLEKQNQQLEKQEERLEKQEERLEKQDQNLGNMSALLSQQQQSQTQMIKQHSFITTKYHREVSTTICSVGYNLLDFKITNI